MKKLILSLIVVVFAFATTAQVVVRGVSPAAIANNFDFTWADPAGGDWSCPDFLVPNTFVEAPIMLADDGTEGVNIQGNPMSAEACNGPLINDMTGFIAIIYRNTCEFGYKALQAENAGALGVIIINRDPEAVGMGGGAEGLNVTIPTVMLSSVDGAVLTDEMVNGEVVVFMGNKQNLFANDGGSSESAVLSPRYGSVPVAMANNGYSFQAGIEVYNFGSDDNTFSVTASVDGPGGNIYSETVSSFVASGDTLAVFNGNPTEFPTVAGASWDAGAYTLTYTIEVNGQVDESDFDNVFVSNFNITDDVLSLASQDAATGMVLANSFPKNHQSVYRTCMHLQDVFPINTSINGLEFAVRATDSIILGEEIYMEVFEWNDPWVDNTFDDLYLVEEGFYYPASNAENELVIYAPFEANFPLIDNQSYLFCLSTYNTNMSFGYDNTLNYNKNVQHYAQPINPVFLDGTWYSGGWLQQPSALSVGIKFDPCPDFQVSLLELINSCGNNGSIDIEAIGGSGAYSYEWTNNTGTIIGTNSAIANLDAGNYSVTVSDNTGNCADRIANYSIEDVSIASDGATSFNSTCAEVADGQIYFSIQHNNFQTFPPYIIELSNGSTDTLYSNNAYAFSLESGTYTYLITDENGCTSSGSNPIVIAANDVNFGINLQANPSAGQSPLLVIFDNNTPNQTNYDFTWYFGDGSSEVNNAGFVTHTYNVDGLWDVTVIAEEITTGCTDTLFLDDYIFSTGGVSCTHIATINQSGPISGCAGSIQLTCNTDPLFTYQWNKNGIPINGATDSEFYPQTNGNYSVTIIQDNCPVTSNSISITIATVNAPFISASGSITSCGGGSITLDAGSGYSSYLWSSGGTGQTEIVTASGDYTVTVTDATTGCSVTSSPYTVNASFMPAQQVCLVGLDSLTNYNRVVWEKPISDGIDSFYVYKEGSAANVYDLIGSVDYLDTALFVDVNSNAAVQAYRYKVSILDTCGTESALGEFHKTIHLTINQGVGQTWNLIWNHYEGFGFPSYNIYRGTDPSNISLLTTIASNLNSYTDLNPPGGTGIYYQIEVVNANGCDPLKATDYGVSRSNIATVGVVNNIELISGSINIFPNPTTNLITIQSETELNNKFKIHDQQGREVMNGKLTGVSTEISLGKLSRGTYTIQVDGNFKPAVIIKQ